MLCTSGGGEMVAAAAAGVVVRGLCFRRGRQRCGWWNVLTGAARQVADATMGLPPLLQGCCINWVEVRICMVEEVRERGLNSKPTCAVCPDLSYKEQENGSSLWTVVGTRSAFKIQNFHSIQGGVVYDPTAGMLCGNHCQCYVVEPVDTRPLENRFIHSTKNGPA
jgi:hypothetical protein